MLLKSNREAVNKSDDVVDFVRKWFDDQPEYERNKEHFWVIGVSCRNRIRYFDLCHIGGVQESVVDPRNVFRIAIMQNATAVVLVHNHPSGNPNPSNEDKMVTDRLCKAGRYLQIKVIDHIILGDPEMNYFSFADEGILT